jgi:uncharacterized protein
MLLLGAHILATGAMPDRGSRFTIGVSRCNLVLVIGRGSRIDRDFKKEVMVKAQHLGIAGRTGLMSAFNNTRGVVLATEVKTAETMLDRRVGLLYRDTFKIGEGLHIVPCDSIHTVGMAFSIDVLFLDDNGIVLEKWCDVQPGRARIGCIRAASVLELPACVVEATGTQPGDVVEFTEVGL